MSLAAAALTASLIISKTGAQPALTASYSASRAAADIAPDWESIREAKVVAAENARATEAAHVAHRDHEDHLRHLAYMERLRNEAQERHSLPMPPWEAVSSTPSGYKPVQAVSEPPGGTTSSPPASTVPTGGSFDPSGTLTPSEVGEVWLEAGGPSWAESSAEAVAMCESGDNTDAYNPSGATGLFQILGAVVPGNLDDALVNAENAVSKFEASGDTWGQWVCQP